MSEKTSNTIPRTNVLGVGISAINIQSAADIITGWVKQKVPCQYVCVRDMHGVMRCQKDEQLRRIHNHAGLVTPDGMPMVWLSRLAGHKNVSRVYGPDLMLAISRLSAIRGYRQYYYGGEEGVPELLTQNLKDKYPGLQVVGTYSPPFRVLSEEEDAALVEQINAIAPDILWVGLSTPKQEYWMAEHAGKLKVPVLIGVGAAFDFHAGIKKQAPGWVQKSGFEWFFRLITEPGRLWKRYLINLPQFLILVLLQITGLKKYPAVEED